MIGAREAAMALACVGAIVVLAIAAVVGLTAAGATWGRVVVVGVSLGALWIGGALWIRLVRLVQAAAAVAQGRQYEGAWVCAHAQGALATIRHSADALLAGPGRAGDAQAARIQNAADELDRAIRVLAAPRR